MQAAVAESFPSAMPFPIDLVASNEDDQPENQIPQDSLVDELRVGFDRLRAMSHTELRGVISSRVALLEKELRDREERRAALETARTASQILDYRRERAKRIHRTVNFSSACAAVASTMLIVAVMV